MARAQAIGVHTCGQSQRRRLKLERLLATAMDIERVELRTQPGSETGQVAYRLVRPRHEATSSPRSETGEADAWLRPRCP